MSELANVGSQVMCTCGCPGNARCPDGLIVMGEPGFIVKGKPGATVGAMTSNCCGSCCKCPNFITTGCYTILVKGKPAAYKGSLATCGVVVGGEPTVLIRG